MKKGTYRYIHAKKTFQIILTITLLIIAIAIYIVGYYLNDEQKNNVFTIIAVLIVLPASKAFTSFVVVAPFKSVTSVKYKEVGSHITSHSILLTDLVLTSTEKVMNLDFLVITEDNVIGVIGKQNQDINYIESYLEKAMRNQDYNCHVKIFNDYKSFINRISTVQNSTSESTVIENMKSHLLTYAI